MISRVKSSNDQQITSKTTANDKNHRLEQPDLQPYHEYEHRLNLRGSIRKTIPQASAGASIPPYRDFILILVYVTATSASRILSQLL
jgi:hypothetical protein